MAPVDPYRAQALPPRGDMIVVEALRDVHQLAAVDAELAERTVEGSEVVLTRLVAADILRGDDCGKVALEPAIAGRETIPVDIGHDDELVVPSERAEGVCRVGKRGPVRHRVREPGCPG